MTLDSIVMLLTDRKLLRISGKRRITTMPSLQVKPDKDGFAKGRAADGTPIKAKIGGKSLAQRIAERDAQDKQASSAESPRQRRARERQERAARRNARKDGQ